MKNRARSAAAALATWAVLGVAPSPASGELAGDASRAAKARALTLELSQDEALRELDGAPESDQLLAVERGRALLYEGRCAEAAHVLARSDLAGSDEVGAMLEVSRGCERTMAGAVVLESSDSGAWLRLHDDADVALAPLLYEVIAASRAVFEKDLGVTMPRPIRVELVRDQIALAAMTGLPVSAARTTGTVGVAKWGRVIIVSPRATSKGYPILDTVAHELAHLALTRGSRDRAPLWLQEGVAREEEARWREATPFDDQPPADDFALFGIRRKLGPDIDKIGPSIALLPSAEEAQVTYAKVQSFMRFYAKEAGPDAMPRLLRELKEAPGSAGIDDIIKKSSNANFADWSERWRAQLERTAKELPEDQKPGAPPPKDLKEVRKRYRLGELMLARGHDAAAAKELGRGHALLPRDAGTRAVLARALSEQGSRERAAKLLAEPKDVSGNDARWWSMRALLGIGDVARAVRVGTGLAPYDPAVTCEEKLAPDVPSDPAQRALCQAARERPRAR